MTGGPDATTTPEVAMAPETTAASKATAEEPIVKIVRGAATPEEVAALVAVLTALPESRPAAGAVRESGNWRKSAYRTRGPLPHGPGAWRRAFFPGV
ncbi:acyl-CoA carboxylase subunit epsilon [Sphaerimonospora sp. CA-214678]|uniref:acyl-CoA carboxylase subunit epsilon n=1 Tax=Sphaerimonospora sp. CA-214678 TaxID=3240029 RepID=UPI003D8FE781